MGVRPMLPRPLGSLDRCSFRNIFLRPSRPREQVGNSVFFRNSYLQKRYQQSCTTPWGGFQTLIDYNSKLKRVHFLSRCNIIVSIYLAVFAVRLIVIVDFTDFRF